MTVPVAVFGVPPNTFLPPSDPRERIREEVGRGTHPIASVTFAPDRQPHPQAEPPKCSCASQRSIPKPSLKPEPE